MIASMIFWSKPYIGKELTIKKCDAFDLGLYHTQVTINN